MAKEIEATCLTSFEIESDGARVRLNLQDSGGEAGSVVLPAQCINQLLMTLPEMARQALRAQTRNEALRLVFPTRSWTLERADVEGKAILTMRTDDGFEVSFVLDPPDITGLGEAIVGAYFDAEDEPALLRLN
jgi:hypothetical protein